LVFVQTFVALVMFSLELPAEVRATSAHLNRFAAALSSLVG
jgi:hypothetical protein